MSIQQTDMHPNQPNQTSDALKHSGEDAAKKVGDKVMRDGRDTLDQMQRGTADAAKKAGDQVVKDGHDAFDTMRDNAADGAKKMSDEALAKGRETFESLKIVSSETTKLIQHAATVSASSGKVVTAQLMKNTMENTHAMMENFNAIIRAKSFTEAFHIQSNFIQSQMSTAAKQFEELLKLSTNTTQKVIHSIDQNIEGVRNASSRNH